MSDDSDVFELTYKSRDSGTKLRFVARSDGRYDLIEEAPTTSGGWREVGHDVVDTVTVEGAIDGATALTEEP